MKRNATILLLLLAALTLAPTAVAHKTVTTDDDRVKITWGFLNEPAVTWTKTGLDLILRDNATNEPIADAEHDIEVALLVGDERHEFDHLKGQHGKAGWYTDVITMTRPGLYSIHIRGTIRDTPVDMVIPGAHEVTDLGETMFPHAGKSPTELEADIAALTTEIGALKDRLTLLEAKATTQAETPVPPTIQRTPAPGFLAMIGVAALAAIAIARWHAGRP